MKCATITSDNNRGGGAAGSRTHRNHFFVRGRKAHHVLHTHRRRRRSRGADRLTYSMHDTHNNKTKQIRCQAKSHRDPFDSARSQTNPHFKICLKSLRRPKATSTLNIPFLPPSPGARHATHQSSTRTCPGSPAVPRQQEARLPAAAAAAGARCCRTAVAHGPRRGWRLSGFLLGRSPSAWSAYSR